MLNVIFTNIGIGINTWRYAKGIIEQYFDRVLLSELARIWRLNRINEFMIKNNIGNFAIYGYGFFMGDFADM